MDKIRINDIGGNKSESAKYAAGKKRNAKKLSDAIGGYAQASKKYKPVNVSRKNRVFK